MKFDVMIPLIVYLCGVFLISLVIYFKQKKSQALSSYYLDNRSMNGFLLAMTMVATYVSASSFIGGPGAAYKYGLGWVLLSMIQVPALWLSLSLLGKKFAILARQYQAITLNDMLYARYKNKTVVTVASVCLVAAFLGAMTVQFIGGARLLETAVGIPYHTGLIAFVVITTVYTALGGFKASIINDALQGVIMLVGAFLLLIAILYTTGGIAPAITKIRAIDPALLTPQGPDNFLSLPFMFSFWVLICFGAVGLPHTAVRCIAYKDSRAMHQGIILGTIIIALLMFTLHFAGTLGRAIIPDLAIPDQIVPTLMVTIFPPYVAGIFLAAPLAAIMSTVNAQLLQSSSVLIKDLYVNLIPEKKSKNTQITSLSRRITLLFGALLVLLAWSPPDMIIWLNLIAFGGLETVFLWPLLLGLYWSKANAVGALSSMLCGSLCYLILLTYQINWLGLHPIVFSLTLGLIAFIVGNSFGSHSKTDPYEENYALDSIKNIHNR